MCKVTKSHKLQLDVYVLQAKGPSVAFSNSV